MSGQGAHLARLVAGLAFPVLAVACLATPQVAPLLPEDAGADADAGVARDAGGDVVCRSYEADIQPIWSLSCALSGCHAPPSPVTQLDLFPGVSHAALVGVRSALSPGLDRVTPGDAARSFLVHKLEGRAPGPRMPLGRPALPPSTVALVVDWIEQGAPAGAFSPCGPPGRGGVGAVAVAPPISPRLGLGQALTLTATASDPEGRPLRRAAFAWRSSDESVLYVDPAGEVLAVGLGSAAIVAGVGGVDSSPVLLEVLPSIPVPATWAEARPVLAARCAGVGCHAGPEPAAALALDGDPAAVRRALVGVPGVGVPGRQRVEPSFPERSLLVDKLTRSDPAAGRQMPLGRPRLLAGEVGALYRWIAAGAPAE